MKNEKHILVKIILFKFNVDQPLINYDYTNYQKLICPMTPL